MFKLNKIIQHEIYKTRERNVLKKMLLLRIRNFLVFYDHKT